MGGDAAEYGCGTPRGAARVTDAAQAVAGFGLVGLKRTVPSLVSTCVWCGPLGLAAVPVARAGGLPWLWAALVAANALQAVGTSRAFHRRTGLLTVTNTAPTAESCARTRS
ncbi:hypothetical protein POF50_023370 [Streptomyces sp. SL13]|uniref:Uncharacterized protein n=1 Tax=Streptantibioticus silvisoli TaxID=2705255 RepID=A0AA90KI57_9ACTN|nr:hypothetical protein [Streptantibioticus silvisoli]MDI5972239.1 hypothetical protein [Streptantibioticus silvisoli]